MTTLEEIGNETREEMEKRFTSEYAEIIRTTKSIERGSRAIINIDLLVQHRTLEAIRGSSVARKIFQQGLIALVGVSLGRLSLEHYARRWGAFLDLLALAD